MPDPRTMMLGKKKSLALVHVAPGHW